MSTKFFDFAAQIVATSTIAEGVASSTVTFTGAWTAGDVIQFHCSGY